MQHVVPKDTTIANGASLSSQTTGVHGTPGGGIDAEGLALVGVEMPAAWTAAAMTFQVSSNGLAGSFKNVKNADGTEFTLVVEADDMIPLAGLIDTLGWRFIKVRSGTKAAAVNQLAARTVRLLFREQRAGEYI